MAFWRFLQLLIFLENGTMTLNFLFIVFFFLALFISSQFWPQPLDRAYCLTFLAIDQTNITNPNCQRYDEDIDALTSEELVKLVAFEKNMNS